MNTTTKAASEPVPAVTSSRLENRFLKAVAVLNAISASGGLVYTFFPHLAYLAIVFGVTYLLTLLANAVMLGLFGSRMARASVVCALSSAVSIFLMLLGNYILCFSYTGGLIDNPTSYVFIYVGYFVPLILGAVFAQRLTQQQGSTATNLETPPRTSLSFGKGLLALALGVDLILGMALGYWTFTGKWLGMFGFFLNPTAVLSGYRLLFEGAALLLLLPTRNLLIRATIVSVTIVNFAIYLVPFFAMPHGLVSAEREMQRAFGPDYASRIPSQFSPFLQKVRFNVMSYFLGATADDCIIKKDVLYYSGTNGVDKGIQLRFDAFMPATDPKQLPGKAAVLIRIHGGGWRIGDKGPGNMVQVNRRFASQGYIVFDVQYGLSTHSSYGKVLPMPRETAGPFSADDMVRHLGLFSQYLAAHAKEYNADINTVFISGGSAGGHLAAALALGITSGKFPTLFASELKVKGLIPFYPAVGLPKVVSIPGSPEWNDPGLLVDSNSPPCLIYEGTQDTLVPGDVVRKFQDEYRRKASQPCAVIWMPTAGHGSDLYFPGNYNMAFVYYMERFMALHRGGP